MMLEVICPLSNFAPVFTSYKGIEIRHALVEQDLEAYFDLIDIIIEHAHDSAHKAIDHIELLGGGYLVVVYRRALCGVYKRSEPNEEPPCDL
jgi:hypothetical protein